MTTDTPNQTICEILEGLKKDGQEIVKVGTVPVGERVGILMCFYGNSSPYLVIRKVYKEVKLGIGIDCPDGIIRYTEPEMLVLYPVIDEVIMRHLIIVRHGDYGNDHHLDGLGRRQINNLAELLQGFTRDMHVRILTSTADRARESAEILLYTLGVRALSITSKEHEILWSERSRPEDLAGTLALVQTQATSAEVLILVTHREYVESFPGYFLREVLGVDQPSRLIEKGEAWVIDCKAETLVHIEQ